MCYSLLAATFPHHAPKCNCVLYCSSARVALLHLEGVICHTSLLVAAPACSQLSHCDRQLLHGATCLHYIHGGTSVSLKKSKGLHSFFMLCTAAFRPWEV